jgi:hypothetical protein
MRRRIEFIVGLGIVVVATILNGLNALHYFDLIDHYLPRSVLEWVNPEHNFVLFLVGWLLGGAAWIEYRYALRKSHSAAVDAKPPAQIEKFEIRFNYLPASPLDNGWSWAYGKSKVNTTPIFKAPPAETSGANGLAMVVPFEHAIDHSIPAVEKVCDELELYVKYQDDAKFYVLVNVTSRDGSQRESHWLNIQPGDSSPTQDASYSKEYIVRVSPQLLPDGWMIMRLRLPALVNACSGEKGWIFDSSERIRLRGCISVSPIKFYTSVDRLIAQNHLSYT